MKNCFLRPLWTLSFSLLIAFLYAQSPQVSNIKKDVYCLASDSLQGRKPGTLGCEQAASYIRDQFKASNLQLMGENGFQYFDVVTEIKTGQKNSLSIGESQYQLNKDFIPFSFSSNSTFSGTVVFAGYGFDFDEDTVKWHDYKDVDVTGKWVILLRGNPEPDKENSIFVQYSKERSKVLTAKDKGAAGVLFVTGATLDKNDELVNLYFDKSKTGSGIPVINIKRGIANTILAATGHTIEEFEVLVNKEKGIKPVLSDVKVSATTDLEFTTVRTANVVALLPGSDPVLKDEYIIVGAHYDHLGMGGQGSGSRKPDTNAVHNGADDNASGTAVVIELARMLSSDKRALKRSVIFVAFSAEEMGLLGSTSFLSHPLINVKKMYLMMNFDMVGRVKPDKQYIAIGGTGTFAEAVPMLDRLILKRKLKANYSSEGYGPSDHAPFYADSIPVLYFNSGAHQDYHTPEDDANLINYEGIADIVQLAFDITLDMENNSKTLSFLEAGPKEKAGYGSSLKVRLGIMPDFANTEAKGVAVGAVTKGGPAENGGVLKGDVITGLNGKTVENIYEYMDRLKTFTPGQTISVDVLRDKAKHVLLILL